MSYDVKYIGMDVHKEAIVITVLNESGKQVMESVIETKASSILQFLHGLRGELHVTWEEGTWAAWLYDLLQPQVQHIVVCNPRRNALLKEGSKSDKVDAGKLADLLRTGMLRPVYHGENGLRTLRELGRSSCRRTEVPKTCDCRQRERALLQKTKAPGKFRRKAQLFWERIWSVAHRRLVGCSVIRCHVKGE
jgi:hypothetical protein